MKIYVASKYEQHKRVEEICQKLEREGHTITLRWWTVEADSTSKAIIDTNAVKEADALVLVVEKDLPYAGAFSELGMAIALGKPVYILGPYANRNVFAYHPLVRRGVLPPPAFDKWEGWDAVDEREEAVQRG